MAGYISFWGPGISIIAQGENLSHLPDSFVRCFAAILYTHHPHHPTRLLLYVLAFVCVSVDGVGTERLPIFYVSFSFIYFDVRDA